MGPEPRAGAVMNLTKVNITNKADPHNVLYHSAKSTPGSVKSTGLIALVPKAYAEFITPIYELSMTVFPKKIFAQKFYLSWHRKFEDDPGHQWSRNVAKNTLKASGDQEI